MASLFKKIKRKSKSKQKKEVVKPKEIPHEESIKALNAILFTEHHIEIIRECGQELEGITNPLIIIISHKSQNSKVFRNDYEQPEHILIFRGETHKGIKDKITPNLGQLARNGTLSKYDGVIIVLLAIGKIHKYENEEKNTEFMKYYYDSTNELRHVDKTKKDIRFRTDNRKLYMHYGEIVIDHVETGKGRPADPADHNYNIGTVKRLKEKKMRRKMAIVTIRGYCRMNNQTHISFYETSQLIFQILFKYYFGDIDNGNISHAQTQSHHFSDTIRKSLISSEPEYKMKAKSAARFVDLNFDPTKMKVVYIKREKQEIAQLVILNKATVNEKKIKIDDEEEKSNMSASLLSDNDENKIRTQVKKVETKKDSKFDEIPAKQEPEPDELEQTENKTDAVCIQTKSKHFGDTIHKTLISTNTLLNLANQLKSNEEFQKQLSCDPNLIVEYTTENKTNNSSSKQTNNSEKSKRNSDDEKGYHSNDKNQSDDGNHNDNNNQKDNYNDPNEDHKCMTQEYNCNVPDHAVRLKQLEDENKQLKDENVKLKLLLQKQTTIDTVSAEEKSEISNFKVTKKLVKKIIPQSTEQSFCNTFDYMNKYLHIHCDAIEDYKCDEKEVKVIDCGIQCKNTNKTLYVICEKQNKLWKTNDYLYSAYELQSIYKLSKLYFTRPVTISDKTIVAIKNAKEHVTHILKNKTERDNIIGNKNTPWNNEDKIPVFNKRCRQNGLILMLEKHQLVGKLKTFADKNVNDIQLIPIVRFNNENKYFYEVAWIVEIGKDINIAISFKHIKNKYLPSAIYLNIHDAHKLVAYKHNCDCLTNFKCFIDRLQIGENKQTRIHQRYEYKMQEQIKKQKNKITQQKHQIDKHENQMQNYLRLREQDMVIIDDVKLTGRNLQRDLQTLLQLQCSVNEQQQACNELHKLNTRSILSNTFHGYSNQLTTQFKNLNSSQYQ